MDYREKCAQDINNEIGNLRKEGKDYLFGSFASFIFAYCFLFEVFFISPIPLFLSILNFITFHYFFLKARLDKFAIERLKAEKEFLENDSNYTISSEDFVKSKMKKLNRDKEKLNYDYNSTKNKLILIILAIIISTFLAYSSVIALILSVVLTSFVYPKIVENEINIKDKIEKINKEINIIEHEMAINAEIMLKNNISSMDNDNSIEDKVKSNNKLVLSDNERLVDSYVNSLDGMESVEKDKEKVKTKSNKE